MGNNLLYHLNFIALAGDLAFTLDMCLRLIR